MIDLKTKGGTLRKTTNGVAPVSPEQNGLFLTNANYKLFIYMVLVPDVDLKTNKVTWFIKHGEHIDNNEKGVIDYIKNKYFSGYKPLFKSELVIGIINMTNHAMSINGQYDPTLVDENRKGSYDKELHSGIVELGFKKLQKNMYGDRAFELFTYPQNWSIDEVKAKLIDYHNSLLENKNVSVPTTVYNARPFTNDFDNKIDNVDKCLLGGCPGSGKEAASLALLIRISDKKNYSNNLINLFTATIPDTLCEPINELVNLKGMNVNGEFVDYNRIKLYIVESWFNSNKKDLTGSAQAYLRYNATFITTANDIQAKHSSDIVPVLIAGYHDIAHKGNSESIREKYASLEGRIGTLLIGEGHKFLKPGNKMWKVFSKLGWKFLMPVTGTPYDLIFGDDDVLFFPPEERSIMTRNDMMLDKLSNPNSPYKNMPEIIWYGINEIFDDVIQSMRNDPRWENDANGMTCQKLHTDYNKETKVFKYIDQLSRMYSRLLASDGFGDSDGLAIKNAPGLCEAAKNHILCILPIGMNGVGVKDYIPELVRQLKDRGSLGPYQPFISYEDDMSDVKEAVNNPNNKTITFTAIKNTTGTNVKGWGSTILMRPVGDSLTFLEQGPEGRIGRASEGKTNSGVFLMELYNAMNLKVQVEEKISIDRGEDKSFNEIVEDFLKCHFFYNGTAGKFTQLDKPDFMKEMENLSAKGNYGIDMCVKVTSAPEDFDLMFNNTTSKESDNIEITNEGNKDAKNKIQKKVAQLQLEFDQDKKKDQSWNNMKKKHLSKLRMLSFTKNFQSIQEGVKLIEKALIDDDLEILNYIGKGVELIPLYMTDTKEIDITWTNRWLLKLQSDNIELETLLELLVDSELNDKQSNFFPIPYDTARLYIGEKIKSTIGNTNNPSIVDPAAGRGIFLILTMIICKELNINIDPKRVYYNDKDKMWYEFFRKINNKFKLGIPEQNITCEDAITKDWKMNEFDLPITNPPFSKAKEFKELLKRLGKDKAILLTDSKFYKGRPDRLQDINTYWYLGGGIFPTAKITSILSIIDIKDSPTFTAVNTSGDSKTLSEKPVIAAGDNLDDWIWANDIVKQIKNGTLKGYTEFKKGNLFRQDLKYDPNGIPFILTAGRQGVDFIDENYASSFEEIQDQAKCWTTISKSHSNDLVGIGKKKIVLSHVSTSHGTLEPIKIANKNTAVSGNSWYLDEDTENAENILAYLKSDKVKRLVSVIKSLTLSNSKDVFGMIPHHSQKDMWK